MAAPTNDNILDCCIAAMTQTKVNQAQSVTELKRHLHSQFSIPNSILDEALLMMSQTAHASVAH